MKRKNLFTKWITLTLATLLLIIGLVGCNASNTGEASTNETSTSTSSYRTLDEIKESGKIVIGVFSYKAPFGYIDENGDYQGYDVYFAERLAEDLGVEVEDALGNADTIAPAVQKGNTTLLD